MTTLAPIETVKLTVEQYLELGEDPSGVRLELIEGEIIVSPSPSRSHAEIVFALAYLLETHIRARKLGKLYLDTDVKFSPVTARRPDIAYFTRSQLGAMPPKILTAAPELCIEVLSPSNIDDDRVNKFELYQAHGVAYYWIIDPEHRSAECFALRDGKYRLIAQGRNDETVQFPPFQDLSMALAEIWTAVS